MSSYKCSEYMSLGPMGTVSGCFIEGQKLNLPLDGWPFVFTASVNCVPGINSQHSSGNPIL